MPDDAATFFNRSKDIEEAFSDRPDIKERLVRALVSDPKNASLFDDIALYVLELKRGGATVDTTSKKRKFEGTDDHTNGEDKPAVEGTWADLKVAPSWKMADVSFSIPQRKKMQIEIVKKDSKIGVKKGGIRGVNNTTSTVEFGVGWGEIDQVFCLPVPEKAKKQHNFVVIPRGADGITPTPEGSAPVEPILWTYVEPTGKELKEGEPPGPETTSKAIDQHLGLYKKQVVYPTQKEFASSIPQPHRKNEKAYHVKAFRGSKEGYLYFTSVGILFGFKKPVAYFPFDMVTSVSYTSVLQRTFNLNITVTIGDQEQEIEFAMLDQADYSGINDYINKHGLKDASLAAARKAKRLNINPTKGEDGEAEENAEGEDGETELQKAERQLQDEEDEEEEDYDPGSDGDSDGSGASSDEEEDGEAEGGEAEDEQDDDEGVDLVADELGSQAEDVEMSDEER